MPEFFALGGGLSVVLEDELGSAGALSSYLEAELGLVSRDATDVAIFLRGTGTVPHNPSEIYGASGAEDASGRFLVPDGAGHWCALNPDVLSVSEHLQVELDLCCRQFKPTVLLDWIVLPVAQFRAAALGLTPLHASGAQLPGMPGPLVFSAWSGVGKTNLVAWALANGGSYFGDDRVVVRTDGYVEPSSRRVAVYGYNRQLVPSLSTSRRLLLSAGDKIHKVARGRSGRLPYLLAYAANGFTATRLSAGSIGGTVGSTTEVFGHLICRATKSKSDSGDLVELEHNPDNRDVARLAGSHTAVMEYEYIWFQRYLQTWRWAKSPCRDPWQELMAAWRENLEAYFSRVSRLGHAYLPHGPAQAVTPQVWRQLVEAFGE